MKLNNLLQYILFRIEKSVIVSFASAHEVAKLTIVTLNTIKCIKSKHLEFFPHVPFVITHGGK